MDAVDAAVLLASCDDRAVRVVRSAPRQRPAASLRLALVALLGSLAGPLGPLGPLILGTNRAWAEDLVPPLSAEAQAHYQAGLAHYAGRRYAEAIAALRAAYELEPRREILFARAQATRLAGDCAAAVPLFEQFLATSPPERQVEATRLALSRCQQGTPAAAALVAPAPPIVGAPVPAAAPAPGSAQRPQAAPVTLAASLPAGGRARWHRDLVGGALAGAALVSAGVATGFFFAAAQASDRADRASVYGPFEVDYVRARSRARTATIALIGAAVLGAGAAGRYVWVYRVGDRPALALGTRF